MTSVNRNILLAIPHSDVGRLLSGRFSRSYVARPRLAMLRRRDQSRKCRRLGSISALSNRTE